MGPFESLGLLVVCILVSIFFSVSELSLAAARQIKLTQMYESGNAAARQVIALQNSPGAFFTLIQIGLNSVAILAGIISESYLTPHFSALVNLFYPSLAQSQLPSYTAFAFVTLSFILFADLIPKRIAMNHPETIAVRVAGPMTLLITVFKPLVWLINGVADLFFKIFGMRAERSDEITDDDLYTMMEAGAAAGLLHANEHQVIENVFEMQSQCVTTAMTPREHLVYLSMADSPAELRAKLGTEEHSRFLVCHDGIDSAIGYVDAKSLLSLLLNNRELAIDSSMMNELVILPDTLTLFEAMDSFKSQGADFAVVMNEYALIVGVVTVKDLMITVMGDWAQTQANEQIIVRDENSWLMEGSTPITDVSRALDIDEFPDPQQYETLAGFLMYSLKRIPKCTEFVSYAGFKFEVIDVDNFKIDQLLVSRIK